MTTLSVKFYAYLAGFIDGDGSILLTNDSRQKKSSIAVRIVAFQKDPKVLKWFQKLTGYGRIRKVSQLSHRIPSDFSHTWTVSSPPEVLDLLTKIKPYLFLKKDPARIAIKAAKLIPEIGQRLSSATKRKRRAVRREWEEYRRCRDGSNS